MTKYPKYKKSKATDFFFNLNRVIFFCNSLNFWVEEVGVSALFVKFYQSLSKLINIAAYIFVAFEWGAFYTQNNLTEKQKGDRFLMSFSHTILYSFTVIMIHHRERVRELWFTLAVTLKKDFNDAETERLMIKTTKFYTSAFVVICGNALIFYGIDGIIQLAYSDGTFVTLIPFWPDVNDHRTVASAARIATYVFWWFFMARITSVYLLVLTITICLSHQYTNLQLYFKSLENIFKQNLPQSIKEARYERALKIGVKLHATTIWCTQQVQETCSMVFSGQIIVNTTVMVLLLSQMVASERTLGNTLPIAATIVSMLFSTGLIMWNAGDVTVEAARLPTAMFLSGWQHCQDKASYRIRRLLLIAITQSQKPVVIRTLGVIELSYQSYLSIVKTSYSIFSVLY
uniref:Odorant receptor n=1 Tax=Planotortrix excessana TaxID=65035 RepID=A0A0B5CN09_9NEOP|nr:olfactory receptor OR66 [Planotortrix excessana]